MVYSLCLTLLMICSCLSTVLGKDGLLSVNNVGQVSSSNVTVGEIYVSMFLHDQLQFLRIDNSGDISMTRRMLLLFLLRSGIESNPGPPKKKKFCREPRKCVTCGRFYGSNDCSCLQSSIERASVGEDYIDRSLSSAPFNNLSLFSKVSNSTDFSRANANLPRVCIDFGIPSVGTPLNTHLLSANSLNGLLPSQTRPVPGDGNCLFSALAVSIGSQTWYHSKLRQRICSALPLLDNAPHFLEIYTTIDGNVVVQTAPNVNEYLNRSGMRSNGVYGTSVEIYGFAQIAVVDVYVYHCMTKLWIVYSYAGDRASMDVSSVFLVHTHAGNHFETVAVLSVEIPTSQQILPHGCVQSSFPDKASQCNLISSSFHANTCAPKCSAYSEFNALTHLCNEGINSSSIRLGGIHNDLLLPGNNFLGGAKIGCEKNISSCVAFSPGVSFNSFPASADSFHAIH